MVQTQTKVGVTEVKKRQGSDKSRSDKERKTRGGTLRFNDMDFNEDEDSAYEASFPSSKEEVYERIRLLCRVVYDRIRIGEMPSFIVTRRDQDNVLLRFIPTGMKVLTVANRENASTKSFYLDTHIRSITSILIILSEAETALRENRPVSQKYVCICRCFVLSCDAT